jgi:uncharacterized protein (DUF433 family)
MGTDVRFEQVVALSRDRAAAVAGLSPRRAEYWARTGVAAPTITHQVSPGKTVRLYAYPELMSLLVAAALNRQSVPLQHIRAVVEHLKSRDFDSPLTQLVFAVIGKRLYFQHSDGEWESSLRPGQVVIWQVLNLEPIRAQIASAASRDEAKIGHLEKRRGVLGGKTVVGGTRIPVATVLSYLERGSTPEEIIHAFPALRMDDVTEIQRLGATG